VRLAETRYAIFEMLDEPGLNSARKNNLHVLKPKRAASRSNAAAADGRRRRSSPTLG